MPNLALSLVLPCLVANGCREAGPTGLHVLQGDAMGSTYTIKYAGTSLDMAAMRAEVDAELRRFDAVFSTYDARSEISRINRHLTTEPIEISDELAQVLAHALEIAALTGGAFDPTLSRLSAVHGFGPGAQAPPSPPPRIAVLGARKLGGWSKVKVEGRTLRKEHPAIELDLNAIAKGAGVDRIAGLLSRQGCTGYMVEIGGETRCHGHKPDGKPWTLGVRDPDSGDARKYVETVQLDDAALATSGSYLQFREWGGTRVHHIFDGRTGGNPSGEVVSVSVIASDCETADAWATALMVLGPREGATVLKAHAPLLRALFLLRRADGRLVRHPFRW